MDRGQINLNTKELALIENLEIKEPVLKSKIKAAAAMIGEAKILVSTREAEIILDFMPIPSGKDPEEAVTLRQKLNTFLRSFRQGSYDMG